MHSVLLKRLWNRWKPINIYIKAEISCGSVWGLAKWRSNFAFSLFLPLSLSFSILICAVMVPSIFIFQFSIKKWEYKIWSIHQYLILFFSFLMKFHTFLTTHNFEKNLCSRNFLSTILQTVPLFFQKRPFFWRNCLMQSFYVQLSLLPFPFPYFFLPSFLFISLTTKQDISFQI